MENKTLNNLVDATLCKIFQQGVLCVAETINGTIEIVGQITSSLMNSKFPYISASMELVKRQSHVFQN